MSVIVIDGPEKAGKSTLIEALKTELAERMYPTLVRHWVGRADPDDRIYLSALQHDTQLPATELVAIWDRGWPSEYVYGTLLGQSRRLAQDPWLGEWNYGRLAKANGLMIMLLGPSPEILASRRDETDLLVDPGEERKLYAEYASRFGWHRLYQHPVEEQVRTIVEAFNYSKFPTIPPAYYGNPSARVIIIDGDSKVGRSFGDLAFQLGWVDAHDCPPPALRSAKLLVTCSAKAFLWASNYVSYKKGEEQEIIQYKEDQLERVLQSIRQTI